MEPVLAVIAAPLLVILALMIAALLGRSKARRTNRRRQAIYLAERIEAKRLGLPPPPPPNEARWG